MVGFILRNTLSDFGAVSRGVCDEDAHGFLRSIVERTSIERDGCRRKKHRSRRKRDPADRRRNVSMNMWGFTPHTFTQLYDGFVEFLRANGSDSRAECYLPNSRQSSWSTRDSPGSRCSDRATPGSASTYREDRPLVVDSIRRLDRRRTLS